VRICVVFWFMLVFDIRCYILYIILYYTIIILLYYIIHYTYIILLYIIHIIILLYIILYSSLLLFYLPSLLIPLLFFPTILLPSLPQYSSPIFPTLPASTPHSFYTCRYLHILIYIISLKNILTPHVLSEWMVEV
jgi:hypothetical protein